MMQDKWSEHYSNSKWCKTSGLSTIAKLIWAYIDSCLHVISNGLTQGYDSSGPVDAQSDGVGVHQLIHNSILHKQTSPN